VLSGWWHKGLGSPQGEGAGGREGHLPLHHAFLQLTPTHDMRNFDTLTHM
jgi:hypothetical protein